MFEIRSSSRSHLFIATATVALTLGCSDSSGTGDARLTVAITDAAHPFLSSASVTIGDVEIIPLGSGGPILLTDAGGTYDLMELQGEVTAQIASLPIPDGEYFQLRLVVTEASVTLENGYEFADGSMSRDLDVPSGAQTGIKINLTDGGAMPGAGIRIAGGETILIVDFDVQQNFTLLGSLEDPLQVPEMLFTPLLRAVVRDVAGSISGTVEDGDGAPVVGATVRATLQEPGTIEELQTAEVTGLTDVSGLFEIFFLAPGQYLVSVESTAGTAPDQLITVDEAANVENIVFVVTP